MHPLFALLAPATIVIAVIFGLLLIGALASAGLLAGKTAFARDVEKEQKHERASKIAAKLEGYGFEWLAQLFHSYSVGNLGGMFDEFRMIEANLKDEAVFDAHMKKTRDKMLAKMLADKTGRQELYDLVDKQRAADDYEEKRIYEKVSAKNAPAPANVSPAKTSPAPSSASLMVPAAAPTS